MSELKPVWDSKSETIDEWLERVNKWRDTVENPCCPHCGHIEREWWEYSGLAKEHEVTRYQIDCVHCDEPYLVDKATEVRFESRIK